MSVKATLRDLLRGKANLASWYFPGVPNDAFGTPNVSNASFGTSAGPVVPWS